MKQTILKNQLFLFINVLLFVLLSNRLILLSRHILGNKFGALENLDTKKAAQITKSLSDNLEKGPITKSLYRYFMFFYTDEYTKRVVYLSPLGSQPGSYTQDITKDIFYTTMFNYHKNKLCYVITTDEIPPESSVYKQLKKTNEVSDSNVYISCPLYMNHYLVGYIGGLTKRDNNPVFIETNIVKNTASNIEDILNN